MYIYIYIHRRPHLISGPTIFQGPTLLQGHTLFSGPHYSRPCPTLCPGRARTRPGNKVGSGNQGWLGNKVWPGVRLGEVTGWGRLIYIYIYIYIYLFCLLPIASILANAIHDLNTY